MERTISGMMGKGSVSHNARTFSAKNVDKERSGDNVEFCHSDIKEVYHALFDDALERYNAKQKRSDRKIDDYYEKIRRSRQEKLFYEAVFQIGNKDDMNVQSSEGQLAKNILCEFTEQFQQRNPNLFVFSAHLHMDEETPHVHIDFVPFIRGSSRGLDTRVSLKGALAEQGFKGGTRGMTEWNQWMESEKQELSKAMERHGVLWKQLGTHNRHLSVLDFEKQERQKEVAALERAISDSKDELSDILYQQAAAGKETEQIRQEGETIRQEVSELSKTKHLLRERTETLAEDQEKLLSENEKLEARQKKLQQEIHKMAQSREVMECNVRAYDEDEKWQLPEPGALMSAKSYHDKKALPLVTKLKEIVKSLTIQCIRFAEQEKRLGEKMDRQQNQISRLTDRVTAQREMIGTLQKKEADLECVRRYVGADRVDAIVANARELERSAAQIKRQQNRASVTGR